MKLFRTKIYSKMNSLYGVVAVLLYVLLFPNLVHAADTGRLSPSSNANPGNICDSLTNSYSDNGSYTFCDKTKFGWFGGYNFSSIPAGSTIDGILLEFKDTYKESGKDSPINARLSWNTRSSWTSVKSIANGTITETGTPGGTYSLGGATDTWGRTWSLAELTSTTFWVEWGVPENTGNEGKVFNDWLTITVYYTPPAAGDTFSGIAYSDAGVTPLASASICVSQNNTTVACDTTDGSGNFTIDTIDSASGDQLTFFIDGGTDRGNLVTVATGDDLTDLRLYENHVIVRHDQGSSINITQMDAYDNDQNATDLLFDAEDLATDTLTVESGTKLWVWTGDTFAPGGNVTVTGSGVSGVDGSMHMGTSSVFTQGGTITLGGSLSASTSATFTSDGSSVTFDATDSGNFINGGFVGSNALGNVVFNGVGGSWSFISNASTTDFTITNGSVTAPSTLTISGDYTNNGNFDHNSGTLYISSTTAQSLSGQMTGTADDFNHIIFLGAGTKTFLDNASTTNNLTISGGTVNASGGSITVGGNYTNNGTFISDTSTTLHFTGNSKTLSGTLTGTNALGNVTFSNSGSWTFSSNASTTDFTITSGLVTAPSVLTISGDYSNSGTFTHSSGVVYFDGASSTIIGTLTGSSAFNDIVLPEAEESGGSEGEFVWSTTTDYINDVDNSEQAEDITTDASNVYVVGRCNGCGGLGDFARRITVYDKSDSSYVWSTTTDLTTSTDAGNGITVDADNVYISGYCDGCGNMGGFALHIMALNKTNGAFVWATTTDPTSGTDVAFDIASDASNLYITGYCTGCGGLGGTAFYTIALNKTNGSFVWETITDKSSSSDWANDIAVDDDNVYVTGRCAVTGCSGIGGYAFYTVAYDKLDGSFNWERVTDITSGTDEANSVTSDGTNVYVTGYCATGCGSLGNNAFYTEAYSTADGSVVWSTTTDPTSGDDKANSITVDASSVYVTGYCNGCGNMGGHAYHTIAYDKSDGSYAWSTTSDPSGTTDRASGITEDTDNIYVTGFCIGCGSLGGATFHTIAYSKGSGSTNRIITIQSNASTSDLTIGSGARLNAPASGVLSVSGNYTNSGTFTHNSGTTTFNGTELQTASGTLTGTSAFYNIDILNNTATTTFSATTTVSNHFLAVQPNTILAFFSGATTTLNTARIVGTSGNEIKLRSTTGSQAHTLYVTGAYTFDYIDVKDSYACPSGTLTANNSIDSTGNTCWNISGAGTAIVLSGALYSDEGSTPITAGKTIALAIGTSTPSLHNITSDGSGMWSFTATTSDMVSSTPIVIWIDGAAEKATHFTKASSSINNIPNLDLYQSRIIISHEGTTGTTTRTTDMAFYDGDDDSDIQYTANGGILLVRTGNELHIKEGKTFAPGGEVIVHGNAGAGTDGSFHLATGATYTAGGTTTIAGNFIASSTSTYTPHSLGAYFSATTTDKRISAASSPLGNITFSGAGGSWTFFGNASTTDFTITSGTVTAPNFLTISGDYSNSGNFIDASGVVHFDGGNAQTLSGELSGTTDDFYSMIFSGVGDKTFSNSASTTHFTNQSGSTVNAPVSLSIAGNYINNGIFTASTGTTTLNGTGTQVLSGTMTGTSAFSNLDITNTSGAGSSTQSVTFSAHASTTGTFSMQASTSAEFLAGGSYTFQDILLNGQNTQYAWLRSTSPNTQYFFHIPGSQTLITYVNVQDNNACAETIIAEDGTNVDAGNNDCWSFVANEESAISSAANQAFALGQEATAIRTITITDAASPNITAANDIRIIIATTTTDMRWDTTDTTAILGGTASAKASMTVSYSANGDTLIIDVESDFGGSDTLTVSGLSFTDFNSFSAPTNALGLRTDGVGTTTNSTDDKTVSISGSLTLTDHTAGLPPNNFDSLSSTGESLFTFNLQSVGENADITNLVFRLTSISNVLTGDLTNLLLYRDVNSDKFFDGGDVAVGGSGTPSISGTSGTITFDTTFTATTTARDYLLIGDFDDIKPGEAMSIALSASDITATGVTSNGTVTPSGTTASLQHYRKGQSIGSGGGEIGGSPPEGQGQQGGGDDGGGGGEAGIDLDTGESLGNEIGFKPPTSNSGSWTNGSHIYSSDGMYVTTASSVSHTFGNFGFNVPLNNEIVGITVKIEASASTNAGTIDVQLSWDGGTSKTTAKNTETASSTDVVYVLGGPSDTWGHSWTPAEGDNGNFTVEVTANPSSNTLKIDALQVRIYYQVTGGGGGGGGGEVSIPSSKHFANVFAALHQFDSFTQILLFAALMSLSISLVLYLIARSRKDVFQDKYQQ